MATTDHLYINVGTLGPELSGLGSPGPRTATIAAMSKDLRFDRATRSRNMAAIRSKGSGIEMKVRRALHGAGFRYRLHRRDLPGRPDIVLPRYRTAVFVDGCFWHGHECIQGHTPRSNTAYWGPKIARNQERDRINRQALQEAGWQVVVVRECSVAEDTASLLGLLHRARAAAPAAGGFPAGASGIRAGDGSGDDGFCQA